MKIALTYLDGDNAGYSIDMPERTFVQLIVDVTESYEDGSYTFVMDWGGSDSTTFKIETDMEHYVARHVWNYLEDAMIDQQCEFYEELFGDDQHDVLRFEVKPRSL